MTPDTANGSEAMKIERWQGISGKIVHDGKNALLVDDDEQLDEKELAKRLEENGKPVEEVRKATFRKTLKKQVKLEPIKLSSWFNRKNDNQNANKSAKLKSDKPVHQYKQIKTELLFFGESFLEGFLDFYGLEVNNALGRYEKNLHVLEIQDLSRSEKEYYLATTNKQGNLRIAAEPLPSQQIAQRELDKFYGQEPKQEEYIGLTNAQKREEDES